MRLFPPLLLLPLLSLSSRSLAQPLPATEPLAFRRSAVRLPAAVPCGPPGARPAPLFGRPPVTFRCPGPPRGMLSGPLLVYNGRPLTPAQAARLPLRGIWRVEWIAGPMAAAVYGSPAALGVYLIRSRNRAFRRQLR